MSITIERFERFPCRAETALRKKRAWIDPEQKLVSFHDTNVFLKRLIIYHC